MGEDNRTFGFAVKEMQEKCWVDKKDEMEGVKMSFQEVSLRLVNLRK